MWLVGTTEAPALERLEERTWDFVHQIDTTPQVHVVAAPDIDDEVMTRVIAAWKAMAHAKEAEAAAARRVRDVVKGLRALGLSLADIAFLTYVSRGARLTATDLIDQQPRSDAIGPEESNHRHRTAVSAPRRMHSLPP